MRASDLLIKSILNSGINRVFSLSGNQIMPIFDSVVDLDMEIIHCRHEASAVFMADGYAQSSGNTGIALVTAAPGFTNSLGPLYAIKANQSPVLLLSGDSPLSQNGLMSFQELNQTKISKELVKKSWRIEDANLIGNDIAEAISLTKKGRPGPVHIALPFDILNEKIVTVTSQNTKKSGPNIITIESEKLQAIEKLLFKSQKPLIITGPSLSESRNKDFYKQLYSSTKIPIITMSSPRGSNDPSLGKLKLALKESDLLIFIDKDIDFTLGFGSKERISSDNIIYISCNDASINHAKEMLKDRALININAEPKSAIASISKLKHNQNYESWLNHVKNLLASRPNKPITKNDKIKPYDLCKLVVNEVENNSDAIYISDGGEFGQWAQSIIPKSKIITNGPSGAIGGATPQAIGASFANPDSIIVCFMGDGTAGFQIAEWETARRHNLPIIYIIGNDQRWGAEVEIQIRDYGKDRAQYCMLDNLTRYDQIAEGMGCQGHFIQSIDQLKKVINEAILSKKTTIIDIQMDGLPAPSF